MRFLTNLMVVASLVFVFIFLQDHYDITARVWQYWIGGGPQAKGSAAPGNLGVSALPADHDYQLVIDVSGNGPFMSVVHGPATAERKDPKKRKKTATKQPAITKDLPQGPPPQQATPQPQITPQPQVATQPVTRSP